MDNELICNKLINQYLLRGRKFVVLASGEISHLMSGETDQS